MRVYCAKRAMFLRSSTCLKGRLLPKLKLVSFGFLALVALIVLGSRLVAWYGQMDHQVTFDLGPGDMSSWTLLLQTSDCLFRLLSSLAVIRRRRHKGRYFLPMVPTCRLQRANQAQNPCSDCTFFLAITGY